MPPTHTHTHSLPAPLSRLCVSYGLIGSGELAVESNYVALSLNLITHCRAQWVLRRPAAAAAVPAYVQIYAYIYARGLCVCETREPKLIVNLRGGRVHRSIRGGNEFSHGKHAWLIGRLLAFKYRLGSTCRLAPSLRTSGF